MKFSPVLGPELRSGAAARARSESGESVRRNRPLCAWSPGWAPVKASAGGMPWEQPGRSSPLRGARSYWKSWLGGKSSPLQLCSLSDPVSFFFLSFLFFFFFWAPAGSFWLKALGAPSWVYSQVSAAAHFHWAERRERAVLLKIKFKAFT